MLKFLGRLAVLAALLMLADCGTHGPVGNDTGGIIPWSPEVEHDALEIAQSNCGSYNKYAVITSVSRHYGDYIAYSCTWRPTRAIYRR